MFSNSTRKINKTDARDVLSKNMKVSVNTPFNPKFLIILLNLGNAPDARQKFI